MYFDIYLTSVILPRHNLRNATGLSGQHIITMLVLSWGFTTDPIFCAL